MERQTLYDWCMSHNLTDLLNQWSYDKNLDYTPKDIFSPESADCSTTVM